MFNPMNLNFKNIMKSRSRIILIPAFIMIAVFLSCSDDTTTNPVTPPGTVLYSADSISIWLPAGIVSYGSDSTYFSVTETGSVKLEFTLQSNVDTPSALGRWDLYTNTTPVIPYFAAITEPRDEFFSLNQNAASGLTYFALAIKLNTFNSTIARYVRIINIRLTKL